MKTLLTFLTFFSIIKSTAQLEKGTWLVGGSGRFQSYKYVARTQFNFNDGKYKEFALNASIGYFPTDKFSIGLKPTFISFKGDFLFNGSGRTKSDKLFIGPFARYYFLEKTKPVNILLDINYSLGKRTDLGDDYDSDISLFSTMLGVEIFFNSTAGIELLVGYNSNIDKFKDGNESKKGLQVSIGFQLHLIK
jgi:hypothetical protein